MKPVKFGVIGCGVIGPTHMAAAADFDYLDLVAVADLIPERAQAAAVGQLHGDPLGPLDDVVVGEDVAGRVDDEAAARPPPRHTGAASPLRSCGRAAPAAILAGAEDVRPLRRNRREVDD